MYEGQSLLKCLELLEEINKDNYSIETQTLIESARLEVASYDRDHYNQCVHCNPERIS